MNCPKCFTPAVEIESDDEFLKVWKCPNPACNHVVDESHLPIPPQLCSACGEVMLQVGFEWKSTDLTLWLACDNCGHSGYHWTDILEPYGCGVCGDETLLVVNDCPLCEKHAAEMNAGKSFREIKAAYDLTENPTEPFTPVDDPDTIIFDRDAAMESSPAIHIGKEVSFNSRDCVVVGFEDGDALLESIFKDENGKPTSKWRVSVGYLENLERTMLKLRREIGEG